MNYTTYNYNQFNSGNDINQNYSNYNYANIDYSNASYENYDTYYSNMDNGTRKDVKRGFKAAFGNVSKKVVKLSFVTAPLAGILYLVQNNKYFNGDNLDKLYAAALVLQIIICLVGGIMCKKSYNDNGIEYNIKNSKMFVIGYIILNLFSQKTAILASTICVTCMFLKSKIKDRNLSTKDALRLALADAAVVISLALYILLISSVMLKIIFEATKIIFKVIASIILFVGLIIYLVTFEPYEVKYIRI